MTSLPHPPPPTSHNHAPHLDLGSSAPRNQLQTSLQSHLDPTFPATPSPPRPPSEPQPQPQPLPRPRTPPHRQIPVKRPLKGILKPPPPPQAKFNFKRDILNPFSTRLGYAAVEESPLSAVVGTGGGSVGHGVQAAAGWVGSAFKRLGAAAAAERSKFDDALLSQQSSSITKPTSLDDASPSGSNSYTHLFDSQGHQDSPSAPSVDSSNLQLSSACPPSLTLPVATTSAGSSDSLSPTNHSTRTFTSSLPSNQAVLSVKALKKVHFTMSDLKIVYPISNTQPPSFDQLNKSRINHARRLLMSNRISQTNNPQGTASTASSGKRRPISNSVNGWNAANLEVLYDECCKTREEGWGVVKIRQILKESAPFPPKVLDLTGVALNTNGSVEVLGDLLSVDFGLNSLVLENCGLEDDGLKSILHALLVSGSLPSISLVNNRKLRAKGWKMVAIFLKKAQSLRNLDLSDNSFDKRSVEYLAQALAGSIRRDDHYTPKANPNQSSETSISDAQTLPLPHISTQPVVIESRNHERHLITELSPDSAAKYDASTAHEDQLIFPQAPLLREDIASPAFQALAAISAVPMAAPSNLVSLRLDRCNLKVVHLDVLSHAVRLSKVKHISLRQNKIGHLGAVALAVMIRDWPTGANTSSAGLLNHLENPREGNTQDSPSIIDSEAIAPRPASRFETSNSVTARQMNLLDDTLAQSHPVVTDPKAPPTKLPNGLLVNLSDSVQHVPSNDIISLIQSELRKANEQRVKLKSKFDSLPKMGQLLTLDVKSNDLKSADVFYLAQVLKKNRTLKVLNLADNKIDCLGLVHLSDALRYNTCLETLDLSKNPCCGSGVEGILALRTTCTINNSLKRLFLSQTELTSEAAIALAEFLPEMHSLIHLDLTENYAIDIAGVMALAVSVKMNTTLRCLDINIPPNDPDFSRLSQDILQSCVRNTELAQRLALKRGTLATISQPMLKSTVVRQLTTRQPHARTSAFVSTKLDSDLVSQPRTSEYKSSHTAVEDNLSAIEATCGVLAELIQEDERRKLNIQRERRAAVVECSDLVRELLDQAKAGQVQIQEALLTVKSDELRVRSAAIEHKLMKTLEYAEIVYRRQSSARVQTGQCLINPTREANATAKSAKTHGVPVAPFENGADPVINPGLYITDIETTISQTASDSSQAEVSQAGARPASKAEPTPLSDPRCTGEGEKANAEMDEEDVEENKQDLNVKQEGVDSLSNHSPRSPVESHSRSLTLEEGEVFRKGSVLRTADVDDEETQELPGDILRESILVTEVKRNPRAPLKLGAPEEDGSDLAIVLPEDT